MTKVSLACFYSDLFTALENIADKLWAPLQRNLQMRGVIINWNGSVKFVTILSPTIRKLRAEKLLLPATSVSATESFYLKIGTLDNPTTPCICMGMGSGACVKNDKWLKN